MRLRNGSTRAASNRYALATWRYQPCAREEDDILDCSGRRGRLRRVRSPSLVACESTNVRRHERLNTVSESTSDFAQRHSSPQPRCGRGMATVVDASACPISRNARCHARDQFEAVGRLPVRVRNNRSSEASACSSSHSRSISTSCGGIGTERGPVLGSPGHRSRCRLRAPRAVPIRPRGAAARSYQHDDFGRTQAGVVRHGGHHLIRPATRLVTSDRVDRVRHRQRVRQLRISCLTRPDLRCERPLGGGGQGQLRGRPTRRIDEYMPLQLSCTDPP